MTILHEFALSSASYRVRIALNLKGIEYESRSYKLRAGEQRSPDYLSLNPAGLVPTLEIDGLRISQSLAITDYLDARFPDPALLPGDPAKRAEILSVALDISCDIHPLNNLRVLLHLEQQLGQDETSVNRWYGHWVDEGFRAVEGRLRTMSRSPFLSGAEPGLAEICLVPQVYNARRYKVDLSSYPAIVELADLASAHPAFVKAAKGMPAV